MPTARTGQRRSVRLFCVPEGALKETSINGSGARRGERVVLAVDHHALVTSSEAKLLDEFHDIIKRLRKRLGVAPSAEALECYRLKHQLRLTVRQIARRFDWPGCSDVESAERRVKRHLRETREYLDRAEERRRGALSARQRAILKLLDNLPPVEAMTD